MSIEKLSTSASLKEVMDKFEEISLQDLSSINIKVLSELPSVAKEDDIVLICNYEYTKIILSANEPTLNNNEIWLGIAVNKEANIKANKVDFISTVVDCYIKINNQLKKVNVYKYSSGKFVHINGDLDIYIAPSCYNTDITGGLRSRGYTGDTSSQKTNSKTDTDNGIELFIERSSTGTSLRNLHTSSKIDLTQYKTFEVKYKIVSLKGTNDHVLFYVGLATSNSEEGKLPLVNSFSSYKMNNNMVDNVGAEYTVSIDVSNLTSALYPKVAIYVGSAYSLKILIQSMRLIR